MMAIATTQDTPIPLEQAMHIFFLDSLKFHCATARHMKFLSSSKHWEIAQLKY